jgi:hypothetical protein
LEDSGFKEDIRNIQKVFSSILGGKVEVKDNFTSTEKTLFFNLAENLLKSYKVEKSVLESDDQIFNMDILSDTVDPLWAVIEQNLNFIYGKEITSALLWFVLESSGKNNGIIPFIDFKGDSYDFSNVNDVWEYVKSIS